MSSITKRTRRNKKGQPVPVFAKAIAEGTLFGATPGEIVECLSGYLPLSTICKLIRNPDTGMPINPRTLHKLFGPEIDRGRAVLKAKLGMNVFVLAEGRPAEYDRKGRCIREELKPAPAAAIFCAKTILGWKEPRDEPPPLPAGLLPPEAQGAPTVYVDNRSINGLSIAQLASEFQRFANGEGTDLDFAEAAPAPEDRGQPGKAGARQSALPK